ncbi:MAG: cytochrome P450 [Pseudomonadota bacterium]
MNAVTPLPDPYSVPLEEIDMSNPDLFQRDLMLPYFERLRDEAPVHFHPGSEYGPFWSVTRYQDIMAVDTNHRLYSSDHSRGGHILGYEMFFIEDQDFELPMFIAMDQPEHDLTRKAVSPAVGAENLLNMEADIRASCVDILESLPVGETFNWVDEFSIELTTRTLATLFDFPFEDRRMLTRWSDISVSTPGSGIVDSWQERRAELEGMDEYFGRLWQERRDKPEAYDLISMMARSPDTKNMSPAEYRGNVILLIVGGNDTTRNTLSGSVLVLNQFPDQYEKLRQDRSLIKSFVPETIRWVTPLAHMKRTALEDAELGGESIRAGDKIVMWYLSGNRDERAIDNPNEFIVDRKKPRNHLSFGFGIHRCVGNRLGELQLRIAWEEILKRFRLVEVVGEPQRVRSNIIMGITDLPVRLHRW